MIEAVIAYLVQSHASRTCHLFAPGTDLLSSASCGGCGNTPRI